MTSMTLQGALIFLCGGDQELFEYASPLLDVMGKAKFFLGEVSYILVPAYESLICLGNMGILEYGLRKQQKVGNSTCTLCYSIRLHKPMAVSETPPPSPQGAVRIAMPKASYFYNHRGSVEGGGAGSQKQPS